MADEIIGRPTLDLKTTSCLMVMINMIIRMMNMTIHSEYDDGDDDDDDDDDDD